MVLRAFLQNWLRTAAKAQLGKVVGEALQGQLPAPEAPPVEELKPCHVGVVFALGIEAGCFEDLLQGAVTIRAHGFRLREGGLHGRRVVLVLSGAGRKNAQRATEMLIDGHRPGLVVSAGFAGGLSPELKRNDIFIADRLVGTSTIDVAGSGLAAGTHPGVHRGALLTADRVVGSPVERRELRDRHGAMAVDMETSAVAGVCVARRVPFSSIRVINDLADETLPRDVEHLLRQRSGAARLGAALGAVCRRPGNLKSLYQLHENALVASGRLARFLSEYIAQQR
ncbi:MAG: hypothetical protein LLG00_07200 [Planctomycetaceae bacterium]|nr:hypothetical protein [Planctomycetaceae bacterium]